MAKIKSTAKKAPRTAPSIRRAAANPAEAVPAPAAAADPAQNRAPTKQALIISLLQRAEGAAVAELVAATGWLPHTTRAALTRLRQAGHVLDKSKGETGAVYRIAAPASPARSARSRKAA